jgi:hypothetical protein
METTSSILDQCYHQPLWFLIFLEDQTQADSITSTYSIDWTNPSSMNHCKNLSLLYPLSVGYLLQSVSLYFRQVLMNWREMIKSHLMCMIAFLIFSWELIPALNQEKIKAFDVRNFLMQSCLSRPKVLSNSTERVLSE